MAQEIKLKKHFVIWDLLKRGWQITVDNFWQIVGLEIAFMVLFLIVSALINYAFPNQPNSHWISRLTNHALTDIIGVLAGLGILNFALRLSDYKSISFNEFFAKAPLFIKYFIASFLYAFCVVIGLLCLIIPGLIILTRFSLFGYFIVDQELGPIEALEKSWKTVRGASWHVFGFLLAYLLVLLVGIVFFGVGFLVAFPVASIATALLYRTLVYQTDVTILAETKNPPI